MNRKNPIDQEWKNRMKEWSGRVYNKCTHCNKTIVPYKNWSYVRDAKNVGKWIHYGCHLKRDYPID